MFRTRPARNRLWTLGMLVIAGLFFAGAASIARSMTPAPVHVAGR